eukprot:1160931-Pelagomonas_calceolata.AAC.5
MHADWLFQMHTHTHTFTGRPISEKRMLGRHRTRAGRPCGTAPSRRGSEPRLAYWLGSQEESGTDPEGPGNGHVGSRCPRSLAAVDSQRQALLA